MKRRASRNEAEIETTDGLPSVRFRFAAQGRAEGNPMKNSLRPFAVSWFVVHLLAAQAGAQAICPEGVKLPMLAAELETLTSTEVLNHLPGPTAEDFGDLRIGTADDGIHPGLKLPPHPGFSPVFGCPNDLAGQSAIPTITCGVPGSADTQLLDGTSFRNSEESGLHTAEGHELSLARPGEGSYSFIKARVGQFESLSYLAGGFDALLRDFEASFALVEIAQVTLGGTTLVPNVFFQGPFNVDLITVGPGEDLSFNARGESGESIVRGCNGLAPGVDEVSDWFPVSPGPFPKFPDVQTTNRGMWNLSQQREDSPEGRTVVTLVDALTKVPTAAGFFVTQDVPLAGYLFPMEEAQVLLSARFRPDGNLPDIPGFPSSGLGLARYIQEVMVPAAAKRNAVLVGFFRGVTTVEIIGVDTLLDITIVADGRMGEFDLCTLDVIPCTF